MNSRKECPMRHTNGNCLVIGGFCTSVSDEYCNGLREAYLCGALREVRRNKWISVNDRMPEQAGYKCLVCAEYGDGKKTVFTAFTGYGEAEWYTYDVLHMEKEREADNRVHHNYRITHWMPLPEPPKEVNK